MLNKIEIVTSSRLVQLRRVTYRPIAYYVSIGLTHSLVHIYRLDFYCGVSGIQALQQICFCNWIWNLKDTF